MSIWLLVGVFVAGVLIGIRIGGVITMRQWREALDSFYVWKKR